MLATAVVLAAAASSDRGAPDGAAELRASLTAAGVPLARGATPAASSFQATWRAFQSFARARKSNADLLFEFGVFESRFWGTSFEIVLTSGEVHLVVHFPVAAYIAITRNLRATPCVSGAGCAFRCFFTGDDSLVPRACRVTIEGYRVGDMRLAEQRSAPWITAVESSPVFRALLSRRFRPVGFEVWAG